MITTTSGIYNNHKASLPSSTTVATSFKAKLNDKEDGNSTLSIKTFSTLFGSVKSVDVGPRKLEGVGMNDMVERSSIGVKQLAKDDIHTRETSTGSTLIVDDDMIKQMAIDNRAKSADPSFMTSRLKRTSSLGNSNHSRPKAQSIAGGDGLRQSQSSVTFDENITFTTGIQNKALGAPQRSKKSSISLFRKLSSLSLSGFFRSDSLRSKSTSNKSITFATTIHMNTSAAPIQSKTTESIEQLSRPSTAPPAEINRNSSNGKEIEMGFMKNNEDESDNSNHNIPKRNETPDIADVKTLNRMQRPNTSIAVVETKDRYKIVPNGDTISCEGALKALSDRIGDHKSARLVINIANALSATVADGDELIKRINLSRDPIPIIKTRSLSTIISQKLGFTSSTNDNDVSPDDSKVPINATKANNSDSDIDLDRDFYKSFEISALTHMFDGIKQPKISVEKYICRLVRYLNSFHEHDPSPDSAGMRAILVATLYIDRIREMHPNFILNSMNIHRLLLATTVIANKFLEDDHPTNEFMAGVGGVELKEINNLESELCEGLNFHIFVTLEELKQLYRSHDPEVPHMPAPPVGHGL